MPWKETCAMDERKKFIEACNESSETFSALCRQFGISRTKGYKWVKRYEQMGEAGLADRPRLAQRRPHARQEEVVDAVLQVRKAHPHWGPKKLVGYLEGKRPEVDWPAASTVGDWLNRYGLIRPRRRRIRGPVGPGQVSRGEEPNQVWCVDFKGWWVMGDGHKCYPLTISDESSRYLLKCEGMLETGGRAVKEEFERVFGEFGLPERMRSDNGPPFASVGPGGLTALSVWWVKLGVVLERIEPGKPQQNGRHERMHRTLEEQVGPEPQQNLMAQQRELDRFRREYNQERPHEALGQSPPALHYHSSRRPYPAQLGHPEYADMKVRWTSHSGMISWRGKTVSLGACLDNEPVGLRQVSETEWEVLYGPVWLGVLDDRDPKPVLRRERGE
jgi:transposase InsO family protein